MGAAHAAVLASQNPCAVSGGFCGSIPANGTVFNIRQLNFNAPSASQALVSVMARAIAKTSISTQRSQSLTPRLSATLAHLRCSVDRAEINSSSSCRHGLGTHLPETVFSISVLRGYSRSRERGFSTMQLTQLPIA